MADMPVRRDTLLFSGHALLPKGTCLHESMKMITFVMEVDAKTGRIVDTCFNTIIPLTNQFLSRILIGYDLNQGIDAALEEIQRRAFLTAERAFLKAIEVGYRKWLAHHQHHGTAGTVRRPGPESLPDLQPDGDF